MPVRTHVPESGLGVGVSIFATVAGKDATFAVTAKSVEAPGEITLDEAFAKTLGLESLAKLRDALRERIEREHASASRQKIKRALLDQLDERHKFEPPPSLVEQEFNNTFFLNHYALPTLLS